jgi:hypothetical protein
MPRGFLKRLELFRQISLSSTDKAKLFVKNGRKTGELQFSLDMSELPDERSFIRSGISAFFAQFLTGIMIGGHMSLAFSIAALDKSEFRNNDSNQRLDTDRASPSGSAMRYAEDAHRTLI